MTTALGEQPRDLIVAAAERGYVVSASQLRRWHGAGLLRPPTRHGSGRARGTRSLYPPGTRDQLLALCALRTRERRLARLAWALWWQGYPVRLALIRSRVVAAATTLSRFHDWCAELTAASERARAGDAEAADPLLEVCERAASARLGSKMARQARKRVGRGGFPTLVRLAIAVGAGTFDGVDAAGDRDEALAELRILARGLAVDVRLTRDDTRLEHAARSHLVPLLRWAAGWARSRPCEAAVRGAGDFELPRARDGLRTLLARGSYAEALAPAALRRTVPIWSAAAARVCRDASAEEQALLLALWLAWRAST